MTYPEDKYSAIDHAIQSLEKTHQLKKQKFMSGDVHRNVFRSDYLFSQRIKTFSTAALQIQNIIRESAGELMEFTHRMRQGIRQTPWALLGKVAVGSFGLGLIMARRMVARSRVKK